jgi:hypothetical protein
MKNLTSRVFETLKKKHYLLYFLFLLCFVVFQIISCSKATLEEQLRSKTSSTAKKAENPFTVKPLESIKFGVIGYMTRIANSSLFITLIEKDPVKGEENEQIILSKEGDNDFAYYDNGSETVQLWWDRKVSGSLRILTEGKEFIINPDPDLKWKYIKGTEEELMEYATVLQKIAAIAADFDQVFFNASTIIIGKGSTDPLNISLKSLKLTAVSKSEGSSCNGPIMESDRYYSFSQDNCCNNLANPDVNAKCSNSYCSECCQPVTCDWTGLLGEYMGYCSSTGTACSE